MENIDILLNEIFGNIFLLLTPWSSWFSSLILVPHSPGLALGILGCLLGVLGLEFPPQLGSVSHPLLLSLGGLLLLLVTLGPLDIMRMIMFLLVLIIHAEQKP